MYETTTQVQPKAPPVRKPAATSAAVPVSTPSVPQPGSVSSVAKPVLIAKPAPAVKPAPPARAARTFSVKANNPDEHGKKIVIFGPAGGGKSTLASLAEGCVIFDLNKGLSGLKANIVEGISGFQDLRDATAQALKMVDEGGTLVIDTVSEADEWICEYLKVSNNKTSIAQLGYDKFPCAVEQFRLLLSDFDPLIRGKRNIVLLAHEATINFKNALGEDYRQIGPKMMHSANDSCRDVLVAWSDHTFRLSLADAQVVSQVDAKGKIVSGKAINRSTERYINTDGNQSLIAKSRLIHVDGEFHRLPSLISFSNPQDNVLWEGLKDPRIFGKE